VKDKEVLNKEYPLLSAVARSSEHVERHAPCVVHLDYSGEGPLVETLLFSGKGVTYDTGGADVKTGGIMAGMSRDKCGAAAIAGLFKTLAVLKPKGIRAVAELGFVRNSVGSDCYVADEVITSHAGQRIKVINTDAEGRMVLADCLSHLRCEVLADMAAHPHPRFFTIATLTGHAMRSVGPYPIAMDNGPAAQEGIAQKLQRAGHLWGDPFEISTIRREDSQAIAPKSTDHDIVQLQSGSSASASRGHQFAAAFLIGASGLSSHSRDSATPLAYTHLDIAGAACEQGSYLFGNPTATPLVALAAAFFIPEN